MAELETYDPYTLADIERYLQGKMTAAEMHAMEKAALQDPFLSDAIEGYSHAPLSTAHAHLNEITAALTAGKEEAKVVTMPVKKRGWGTWVAAAVAIVAVVTATLFITRPSEKSPVQLAAKQTNTPVFTDTPRSHEPVGAAPAAGDIAALAKKDNAKAQKNDSAAVAYNYTQPVASEMVVSDKPGENKAFAEVPKQPDTTFKLSRQVTLAQATTLNKSKRLANTYSNNVPENNALLNKVSGPSYQQNINIQVPVAANATTLATTASGNVDSINQGLAGRTAGVYITQPSKDMFLPPAGNKAKKSSGMQIVLTPIPNFDTVAITYLNNKNKSPKMVVDSSLSPQGGWASFRDYVVKRLDKNADTTDLVEGDVELEFTIDDSGLAKDIRVTRSLDISHDAQAADLVKKWPGWVTSKKQKKGKVVIQF